ncbi:MAG: S8 family serine peptidase [Solirubrobacterales bacterium]|nr:S8 family serine peptidase [Solirubrobacterales bacterium]
MHKSEDQTGEGRPVRLAKGIGETPAISLLLAFGLAVLFAFSAAGPASAASQEPPMVLPADAGASSTRSGADASRWIVGGQPGPETARIADSVGAVEIAGRLGSYRVKRGEAVLLADRLRAAGLLVYSEPDVEVTRSGYPLDSLSDQQWWLNRIVSPGDVTPPTVTSDSPLIGVIEESLDPLHPDLLSANLSGAKSLGPEADWHGTAIAGIIGSPGEMLGIRGVWPGARMQLFPSGLTCSTASKAVTKAVNKGVSVLNLSYTFPAGSCFTHFVATQYAIRKGVVVVASAGNSGDRGNAPMRPAVDPHVISVGAVQNSSDPLNPSLIAPFSTTNPGVDLTAPGAEVLAPMVTQTSTGVERNWRLQNGTSFSAPMVSATAAWLRQVRPELGNLQIGSLMTNSATDLGEPGRDPQYGEGLLSIERSLTEPNPPIDPYEPNDDIRWIDGSLIKPKTPYLWRAGSGKRRILNATLSRAKDPADVYRILIPARRRIVVNVSQLEGNVVVSALKPGARTIAKPGKNLIVRSNRPYPKTEGIVVRNLKKRAQTIWLAITPSGNQTGNDSRYRIKVVRR